jgi:uncharacterized membrane protein
MNLVHLEGIRDRRPQAHRRSERGEGKAKAIIVTAIILFAIYSAVKIVPAYVKEYQLQDKMQEQARFGVVNRYPEEKIREIIFKEVQDQGLEDRIKREDIKIVSNAGGSTGVVKIAIDYTVPVDLLVYRFDLHFTPSSENKALF